MKFLVILVVMLAYYRVTAYPTNPRMALLRQLLDGPDGMTVMISPEKRGDPKINPTSARPGRGGQWDLKGSETPLIFLEDLISDYEANKDSMDKCQS